jgi:hypothetical protein
MRAGLIVMAGVILYAQSLTGGRGGYLTWGAIGVAFGCLKWRKVLLVLPVIVVSVMLFMPSIVDRVLAGIINESSQGVAVDQYEVSAGRNIMWPYVIEQIKRSPAVGYGRQAMMRQGIVAFLYDFLNEEFGHPHNAYLEWLLDNGIVGFIPVMLFYIVILFHSFRLFLDARSPLFQAAGGVSCALILALLVGGLTSQSFYPVEGTIEMWCAMGVMMRMSVERRRALATLNAPVYNVGRFRVAEPAAAPQTLEQLILPRDYPDAPQRPRGFGEPAPTATPAFAPRFVATGPVSRPDSWQHRRPPPSSGERPGGRFQFF